jgi:multiple sugar transport system substrate-binding protein
VDASGWRTYRGGLSRRNLLRLGMGTAGMLALGGCAPSNEEIVRGMTRTGENLVFLSTQLRPIQEAEAVRNSILAGFDRPVQFVPEEVGPFIDRVIAEARAGQGTLGVLGGLHGELATLDEQGLLADLNDLADQLSDRNFNPAFLELARFEGNQVSYIPWMQATYIMAARREALEYLPDGANLETLRYEDWAAWGRNIVRATGAQRLGFPAADNGLISRFFQGYSYPSFTGGVNTTFSSTQAVDMWQWMRDVWAQTNPQSLTYGFMQEPLLSGEVWIAWDHVARLINALSSDPEEFVAFPAPRGPEGLGYMPVVAGLAIPTNAPDPEGSRALIEYLTRPETTVITLRTVAFFPPFAQQQTTDDLDPGLQAEAEAVEATLRSDKALLALLPVGLGVEANNYDEVFRTTFERIALAGDEISKDEIQGVLEAQAARVQEILNRAGAGCWAPDPKSEGTCQVG